MCTSCCAHPFVPGKREGRGEGNSLSSTCGGVCCLRWSIAGAAAWLPPSSRPARPAPCAAAPWPLTSANTSAVCVLGMVGGVWFVAVLLDPLSPPPPRSRPPPPQTSLTPQPQARAMSARAASSGWFEGDGVVVAAVVCVCLCVRQHRPWSRSTPPGSSFPPPSSPKLFGLWKQRPVLRQSLPVPRGDALPLLCHLRHPALRAGLVVGVADCLRQPSLPSACPPADLYRIESDPCDNRIL